MASSTTTSGSFANLSGAGAGPLPGAGGGLGVGGTYTGSAGNSLLRRGLQMAQDWDIELPLSSQEYAGAVGAREWFTTAVRQSNWRALEGVPYHQVYGLYLPAVLVAGAYAEVWLPAPLLVADLYTVGWQVTGLTMAEANLAHPGIVNGNVSVPLLPGVYVALPSYLFLPEPVSQLPGQSVRDDRSVGLTTPTHYTGSDYEDLAPAPAAPPCLQQPPSQLRSRSRSASRSPRRRRSPRPTRRRWPTTCPKSRPRGPRSRPPRSRSRRRRAGPRRRSLAWT